MASNQQPAGGVSSDKCCPQGGKTEKKIEKTFAKPKQNMSFAC